MRNEGALDVSKLTLEEAAAFFVELESASLADVQPQITRLMPRPPPTSNESNVAPIPSPHQPSVQELPQRPTQPQPQQHLSMLSDMKMPSGAQKPKKKRVRRQKVELDYLRDLVGKLESKMAQLKARPGNEQLTEKANGFHQGNNFPATSAHSAANPTPTVWQSIAERQFEERSRAEEQNRKLRTSLEGQLKLASKLERLLRKRPRDEEVAKLTDMKLMNPHADDEVRTQLTDDGIFADQMAHVERAHVEVERLFQGAAFADRMASFSGMNIESDASADTGVAFVSQVNSTLPFSMEVCSNAIWRAVAIDGIMKNCYFNDERERTDNLVVRTYGQLFTCDTFRVNIRGKHTFRRFVDADNRIVLMWKSMIEPVQLNGTKFHGLQAHQTGCIRLENKVLAESSTSDDSTLGPMLSTALQSYAKMTLELQDNIVDQEFQVGLLTDFVVNSHDTTEALYTKMVQEFLVEEDWNINGWIDNLMTDVSVLSRDVQRS